MKKGPSGEKAIADEYVVIFRKGFGITTFEDLIKSYGKNLNPDCDWYSKFPQGFSCAKGSPPIGDCFFDRFDPVDCSNIVLKIATKDCDNERRDDCFKHVNLQFELLFPVDLLFPVNRKNGCGLLHLYKVLQSPIQHR